MENMGSREVMFFNPSTGKLHTSKPTGAADPDKVVAVKMNDPQSGGFFLDLPSTSGRTNKNVFYVSLLKRNFRGSTALNLT